MQKENFLTHKILPILSIILLCSFVFISNNCFASYNINDNGTSVDLPDLPFDVNEHPDYVVCLNRNGGVYYYAVAYPSSDYDKFFMYNYDNNYFAYYISGTSTKGQWTYWEVSPDNLSAGWSKHYTNGGLIKLGSLGYVIYSSFDIYTDDTYTEIFFQKAPVTAVEIPALETAQQIPEAITTTLKLIIPVGLVVLLIFLVIYLMRRLIYRSL